MLDLLASRHGEHNIPPAAGDPVFSYPFWLILMVAHLVANFTCASVCMRYGWRASTRSVRVSLHLFGIGTALAGVYWLDFASAHGRHRLAHGGHAPIDESARPVQSSGHLGAVRRYYWPEDRHDSDHVASVATWRELVDAVPHVVLARPQKRLLETLWPAVPRELLLYRKVIETRDAILVLNSYVAAGTWDHARCHVAEAHVSQTKAEATTLACVLRRARNDKLAGIPPQPPVDGSGSFDNGDLDSEKTFLLDVAQAYASTPARTFTTHPNLSDSM
ncbi:DUF6545 domain-containing protein [Streptomyces sp. Rer75]|uniref:DUF6545 domain-containing protein n=1 Tax=Streptomyces sp. Rer75 TaxID=2750011 RepID=UPI0015D00257|nr:DUF6545 domain-containing protein [Streptomyces sp. Rer75]QLH26691.1 hypothetical protein HYQ63_43905 [Streptomyces sp. Rer75]